MALDLVSIGRVGICLAVTGSSSRAVVAAAACRPMLAGGASSAPCDARGWVLCVGAADVELDMFLEVDILEEIAESGRRGYGT